MGYSYDKLWKLLIDKKMNKEELWKNGNVFCYFRSYG